MSTEINNNSDLNSVDSRDTSGMEDEMVNEVEAYSHAEENVRPLERDAKEDTSIAGRTRSHASEILRSLTHQDNEDEAELYKMVSNNAGVQKIYSRLESEYGRTGPLEEPIDLERIETKPDPKSTFHEEDEWKYPIDEETGLRLVEFVVGDKADPRNWKKSKKWFVTILLGCICFNVAFASAVVTGDIDGPMATFGVSEEVVILTVTLLVLGFGFGPLLFSPLSEELGRSAIYFSTLFLASIFIIPCAVAKNIGTLLVFRLLDGIAFSAPMTLIGGSLADMWVNKERGTAMALFSAAPFLGPCIGPLVGGFIGQYAGHSASTSPVSDYNVGWRWIYWVMFIFTFCLYIFTVVVLPETHHTTILKRRAKKLRKLTKDNKYRAVAELKIRSNKEIIKETLKRPLLLLSEVIVFLITLYMSVIYGLLYMFFFAYPVVFGEGKGWSDAKIGLTFIPIACGVIAGTIAAPFVNEDYNKRAQKYFDRGELPPPELRLIPMMIGCWFVPIGLFIFAWTSYPTVSCWGPIIAGFPAGAGFVLLYNPANNYIVDSYQHFAASALAAKTFVRSVWGASVVLFTVQMYHRLGYQWATSLMAFISLACCAIPYLFFIYGASVRRKSKYAYSPSIDDKVQKSVTETVSSHNSSYTKGENNSIA
ncbi:hypothetical protein PACTADRAFT_50704 [Pachysolen tannophilus NRRL Y-2460]|uniref:Major facilitator superfamily (MFS) profile domain-containing protein n=1 Tax=Pachysolen tannophilus NRRL Y-2460 TaxID=669874 RepID=A0A1E4TSX2_PACTA|nr:hypothetical protein PACTADRAFT_50704 [Pachysolen tannophilus NRRL Y-2460]